MLALRIFNTSSIWHIIFVSMYEEDIACFNHLQDDVPMRASNIININSICLVQNLINRLGVCLQKQQLQIRTPLLSLSMFTLFINRDRSSIKHKWTVQQINFLASTNFLSLKFWKSESKFEITISNFKSHRKSDVTASIQHYLQMMQMTALDLYTWFQPYGNST